MKSQDLADAQAIALLIENGTATRRDWVAFLIYIRESIPNDMVKDIAHFVAHTKRDRGYSFKYIEAFISHMFDVFRSGGTLKINGVFDVNQLVGQLCRDVNNLGIGLAKDSVLAHRRELLDTLSSVLDGSTFEVKHPEVSSCEIAFSQVDANGSPELFFKVGTAKDVPGVIRVPGGIFLAFAMFC